jgi:hypothetical protein
VAAHRPPSTPRLYNLPEVARDRSWIPVHTRCRRKEGVPWGGWAVWPGEKPTEPRTYYEVKLT